MIIDGNALAGKVLERVREGAARASLAPHLTIITMAPDFVTTTYLTYKKKHAAAAGIGVNVIEVTKDATTEEVIQIVQQAALHTDALVVQLPLPGHIDTDAVLAALPPTHDVDAFRYAGEGGELLPPVVGAIAEIMRVHEVEAAGARVLVIGRGRLVGAPAAHFFTDAGATVTVADKDTPADTLHTALASADIVVSGAGVPALITPLHVKDGVVIFDAGTSEDSGKLAGDAAPEVAEKAAIFTPVPGGIGPLTIACLLENVLKAAETNSTRATY